MYKDRFYFLKQNFFYLNDARGNSIINPQLVHNTFMVGCQMNRLPNDVDMSDLFRAPSLINFYCVRCPGYLTESFKENWNLNNRTFFTVVQNDDLEDRADKMTNKNLLTNVLSMTSQSKIIRPSVIIPPIIPPGIIKSNDDKIKITNQKLVQITTKSNKINEDKSTIKSKLVNTFERMDEFVLNIWSFITQHLLFGILLSIIFISIIYLCRRGKNKFLRSNRPDEARLLRKGKARRKEMIRRNRRWN